MKKLILLCFICMISPVVFAQNCLEITDPITNEKVHEFEFTHTVRMFPLPVYQFKYIAKFGYVTLSKGYFFEGVHETVFREGTEVFFKLKNGEIIKLKSIKPTLPKLHTGYGPIITEYNYVFDLDKETLAKLASSPVIFMRVPKPNEEAYFDMDEKNDIIKKNAKPLMKGAECISAYLK